MRIEAGSRLVLFVSHSYLRSDLCVYGCGEHSPGEYSLCECSPTNPHLLAGRGSIRQRSTPHFHVLNPKLVACIYRTSEGKDVNSQYSRVTMETLSAKGLQIFREKSRTFCGSFRISLDKLEYEKLPNNPRQLDEKNVARLLNVFRAEDCQPREPENHVPTLVSRSALPQDSRSGGVGGVFEEPQWFLPKSPLRVLHGRHRLEAARKFLQGADRWWVVDLYSDGAKVSLQFPGTFVDTSRPQLPCEERITRTRP